MSISILHLHKLLKLCGLSEQGLTSAIRRDLREELRRSEQASGGGDFHTPWWSDAKGHVFGYVDLIPQTDFRVKQNDKRVRLYPMLTSGFLDWLKELRRGTNARIGRLEENVHNHYPVPGTNLIVKVDNLLSLRIGDDAHKLVYPYFSEKPVLQPQWARVGLWLMSEALPDFSVTDMEILDVLRGRSYSGLTTFFRGDEEAIFAARYAEIVAEWERLMPEYLS